MKLNLRIVIDCLTEYDMEIQLRSDRLVRELEYPVTYVKKGALAVNQLLIVNAEELPSCLGGRERISVMCVGEPEVGLRVLNMDLVIIKSKVSVHEVLNRVSEIFSKYNQWEYELSRVNALQLPLSSFGALGEQMFNNPVSLLNPQQMFLFFSADVFKYSMPQNYDYGEVNSYFSPETMSIMKVHPEYLDAENMRGPTIFPDSLFGYRGLYINLFFSDVYSGRIVIDEIGRPITDGDYALLEIFAEHVKAGIQLRENVNLGRPKYMDDILLELLNRNAVDKDRATQIISELNWNIEDSYFCIVVEPTEYDSAMQTSLPLAIKLSSLLMANTYLLFKDKVVVLVNQSASGKEQKELFRGVLPLLRDSMVKAGISTVFEDFTALYYYYSQCLEALRIGKQKQEMYWYYHFEDYISDYLMDKCVSDMIPAALMPSGLLRLIKHDRENGTDYCRILHVFLENNMNTTHTIKKLYVHKNTFLYRLGKIKEILDMDIDDSNTRFLLMLAFRIAGT